MLQSKEGWIISSFLKQKPVMGTPLGCDVYLPSGQAASSQVSVLGWVSGFSSSLSSVHSTVRSGAKSCSHVVMFCSGMQCCCWYAANAESLVTASSAD